jgi:hypothetical protein
MQENNNASESSKHKLEASEEMRKRANKIITNGDVYKYLIDITKYVPKKAVV